MKILFRICLVGVAGLWGWALFWSKAVEELPARFVGEFVLDRDLYVPGENADQNADPPGQERHFYFFQDGSYKARIMVSGGYEMWRQEGFAEMRDGLFVLTQISVNRERARREPHRYEPSWGQDKKGEYLRLKEIDRGYELFLRPVK